MEQLAMTIWAYKKIIEKKFVNMEERALLKNITANKIIKKLFRWTQKDDVVTLKLYDTWEWFWWLFGFDNWFWLPTSYNNWMIRSNQSKIKDVNNLAIDLLKTWLDLVSAKVFDIMIFHFLNLYLFPSMIFDFLNLLPSFNNAKLT